MKKAKGRFTKSSKKSRSKRKPGNKAGSSLKSDILHLFKKHSNTPHNYKQVANRLGISNATKRKKIIASLAALSKEGYLDELSPGKYVFVQTPEMIEGTIDFATSGAAFVSVEGIEQDIYISSNHTGRALNGDRVLVTLMRKRRGKRPEGRVENVISRNKTIFSGTLQVSQKFAFLVPHDRKVLVDFFVPLSHLKGGKDGEKAVVEMQDWPEHADNPIGHIMKVLGEQGDIEAEMEAMILEGGFRLNFPKDVKAQIRSVSHEIEEEEIKQRIDLRAVTTFTIDPEDARDFDDALSYELLPNKRHRIGVHIADVSHYVRPGDAIDQEAQLRHTSVYMVDRVVPMLPELLSNEICSLRPDEDKLSFSVFFEMNDDAQVVNHQIASTVIRSNRRFIYEEIDDICEKGKGDFHKEVQVIMNLSKLLRKERMKEGAFNFNKTEVRLQLDESKTPIGVKLKQQNDSHRMIEEFMLLANRTVAEDMNKKMQNQFVYRVHDRPDPEKLAVFAQVAKSLGHRIDIANDRVFAKQMNKLLEEIKGKRESAMLETLAIRSMAKAIYDVKNIGHYGLAFKHYTHFTSPIRRYPDVLVHRIVKSLLAGENTQYPAEVLSSLLKKSSEMERKAEWIERESTKYFQMIMLQQYIGKTCQGVVSGVTEWGIYVELKENKCEGMIRLKEMTGDYFWFDESNFCVEGQRSKQRIHLGDELLVIVKSVSLEKRQASFSMAEEQDV